MAVVDVCPYDEWTTETLRNGFLELGVVQVFQVLTSSKLDNPDTVLGAIGLPAIGSSAVFGTNTMWLLDRKAKRQDYPATGKKWFVTCSWSNMTQNFSRDVNGNPITDPTNAVKSVTVEFQEYSQPIVDAFYLNQTQGGGYDVGTVIPPPEPTWIDPLVAGPIRVSTGEPVNAERVAYTEVITVERNERNWNNALYKPFTNAINELQVVITEEDSEGTRATNTYAPFTLRMKPITKEPFWQDAKMYYRIHFEMEFNELTWIHSEQDRSINSRVFVGGTSSTGDTYIQSDVDSAGNSTGDSYAWWSLTNPPIEPGDPVTNVVAIGEPTKLNGEGNPMPRARGNGTAYDNNKDIYLNYDIYPVLDYAPLNL